MIGFSRTLSFFTRKEKLRGSLCFLLGVLLVFLKWPFIGMSIELFGFINLFGDFFPVAISFIRRLPLIGSLLNAPGISHVFFTFFFNN